MRHYINNLNGSPGCTPPHDLSTTYLVDTAASISLLGLKAPAKESQHQLPVQDILQPDGSDIWTKKTLEILLNNLPKGA